MNVHSYFSVQPSGQLLIPFSPIQPLRSFWGCSLFDRFFGALVNPHTLIQSAFFILPSVQGTSTVFLEFSVPSSLRSPNRNGVLLGLRDRHSVLDPVLQIPTLKAMQGETKICERCGRTMEWRKKWAANWESVRYCSQQCRRTRLTAADERIEAKLVELCRARGRSKTICPSEAARGLEPQEWRALMPAIRKAANRLVHRGELKMLQKGRVVSPDSARGPYRLRIEA